MELKVNTKKIKIEELKPNKWNPKLKIEEDPDVQQQYEEVVKSIKTFGLVDPIMVRSENEKGEKLGYYEIINGYHRFLACQELKMKEVIINDLGKISDLDARKLTIVTEEVKIPIDQVKLSELLKEMSDGIDIEKLVDGLPYSKELIESKIELLDFDWDKMNEGEPPNAGDGFPTEEPPAEKILTLIFDNKEDKVLVEEFLELIKKQEGASNPIAGLLSFIKKYGKSRNTKEK